MTQSFLSMPNFSKTYLYVTPTTLYHEFCNAFTFFTMVKACNPKMNWQNLMDAANNKWLSPNYCANSLSSHLSSRLSNEESDLAPNASAQRQALNLIKEAEAKANEYEGLLLNTSDKDLRSHIYEKLKDSRAIIEREKKI
ncbi:retrotransposable element [Gigaspora margarita]|uniref:Retrotransposable element n=1 Tax=Gigaspora margarita TaxID=4874 RepID=A0A8H4ETM8_GIGMA|nr:retrotransposable element [Gigaspora margarita]